MEQGRKEKLSRLGRKPVNIPSDVKVSVVGSTVSVEGSKGKLTWTLPTSILANVEGSQVKLSAANFEAKTKSLHGLSRKLVLNMVEGVSRGFQKKLIIEGVGYRQQISGHKMTMTLGFSHPVVFEAPQGITLRSEPKTPQILIIEGSDKQQVGEVAAQIRSIRPPEVYKGTGIRYENEIVHRKAGKAAVGSTGGGKK